MLNLYDYRICVPILFCKVEQYDCKKNLYHSVTLTNEYKCAFKCIRIHIMFFESLMCVDCYLNSYNIAQSAGAVEYIDCTTADM